MDALVIPEPVRVGIEQIQTGPTEARPKEQEVRFRMTLVADDTYVHLRDIEAALYKIGAVDVARRIVVACGQRPAQ